MEANYNIKYQTTKHTREKRDWKGTMREMIQEISSI
jgi:hypothetical protein